MVTQQLLDYIESQIKLGSSKESIIPFLVPQGWSTADINEAFAKLQTKDTPQVNVVPISQIQIKKKNKLLPRLMMVLVVLIAIVLGLYWYGLKVSQNAPAVNTPAASVPIENIAPPQEIVPIHATSTDDVLIQNVATSTHPVSTTTPAVTSSTTPVTLTSLAFTNPVLSSCTIGDIQNLPGFIMQKYSDGTSVSAVVGSPPIIYRSSDTSVATVNAKGILTTVANGSATIAASENGVTASAVLTVDTSACK